MNDLYHRLLTVAVCLMCAFAVLLSDTTAFAQEGEDEDPKAEESAKSAGAEGEEGDEDAALAAARRRFGPNKATAKVGDDEKEIFLIGPKVPINEDPDYPKVDELKDGDLVVMTLGQTIKLSTEFDLQFGDLIVKNANFHPDYPGVYGLWLKKQADGWHLVFNEKPDVWSTMYRDEFDVGEVPVQYFRLGTPEEGLKFDVYADKDGGTLTIRWGMHEWKAPFTIQQ